MNMNFKYLQQFLDSLPSTYGIPGASCRVWHRHEEVFRHDVGIRDIETGEAMRGNEQFDVYSASKPVTAVACMQLIEKGWLSPRDPISRYFPSYANRRGRLASPSQKTHHISPCIVYDIRLSIHHGYPCCQKNARRSGRHSHNSRVCGSHGRPTCLF